MKTVIINVESKAILKEYEQIIPVMELSKIQVIGKWYEVHDTLLNCDKGLFEIHVIAI